MITKFFVIKVFAMLLILAWLRRKNSVQAT